MGIDEALLDDAADDTTVTLSALASPAGANRPATAPPVESQEQELASMSGPWQVNVKWLVRLLNECETAIHWKRWLRVLEQTSWP